MKGGTDVCTNAGGLAVGETGLPGANETLEPQPEEESRRATNTRDAVRNAGPPVQRANLAISTMAASPAFLRTRRRAGRQRSMLAGGQAGQRYAGYAYHDTSATGAG
ncbi:hypothetical protein Dda_5989 [Drechslerella dactyloides]|uniref:Uncharacterized protein n=1 Tax=Drechslerella dactyloides TaxID=74499 RepID=A0AAD6IZ65_DREDA|nr:hypothetical protein Dda_5989 [Drechslerella dactyloides]